MAVNVRGTYLMVRHVAPHMMARRTGKIINIASGRLQRRAAYAALCDVEGRHARLHPRIVARTGRIGIAVNSLSPGYILSDTGLANAAHVEEERIPVRNSRAFKRDAFPGGPARHFDFPGRSDSDFVTGQSL